MPGLVVYSTVTGLAEGVLMVTVKTASCLVPSRMIPLNLQSAAKKLGRPWDWGKAFDNSAVIGPLHSVEQVGHPDQGAIRVLVNGDLRQEGDLSEMIWTIPEVISILSRSMSLQPGDLIMTGTPAGVSPMVAGDTCVVQVEGLGEITTKIGPAG